MQFGTAVHNTIEMMTKVHTADGKLPSMTKVKETLELRLSRLPLSNHSFTNLLEKGLEILTVYAEHLKESLPKHTKEELKIRVLLKTGLEELPEIPLTGKLDRIDLADDGTALRVIDYKTGKPKSRNHIEGKTQGSDGGYKRQLVFYALLLQLHDDERYQTRNGVLSFVEPTPKGEVKEESFTITDEEIEGLKGEIIDAVQKLLSGEAFTTPCDPSTSDYCGFASQLLRS
jgi:RecB family exonuclease